MQHIPTKCSGRDVSRPSDRQGSSVKRSKIAIYIITIFLHLVVAFQFYSDIHRLGISVKWINEGIILLISSFIFASMTFFLQHLHLKIFFLIVHAISIFLFGISLTKCLSIELIMLLVLIAETLFYFSFLWGISLSISSIAVTILLQYTPKSWDIGLPYPSLNT